MAGADEREQLTEALARVTSALPGGGEQRPGQTSMAQAVARAAADGRNLIVQAGTGTGKSLAYLLPLVQRGRKAVVATATKALQDQLAEKDLPFLASRLGTRFSFSVLKGRSNYLCRQRLVERTGPEQETLEGTGPSEGAVRGGRFAGQVARILAWSATTTTGDRAELDFEPDGVVWGALSVTAHECPGALRCPSGATCFAEAARARAEAADIVVVNTHLYAAHVASELVLLPEHELVVFDEAHEVEDIMTTGLGVEITPGRLRSLGQVARGLLGPEEQSAADELVRAAEPFEAALAAAAGRRIDLAPPAAGDGAGVTPPTRSTTGGDARPECRPGPERRPSPEPRRGREPEGLELALPAGTGATGAAAGSRPAGSPVPDAALAVATALELASRRVGAVTAALRRAEASADGEQRLLRAVQVAARLRADLHAAAVVDEDHVAWSEATGSRRESFALRVAPVVVGRLLSERLWPAVSAVLTSATVPVDLRDRLGLPAARTDELDVGSPFPFERSALLYCASRLPDPRHAGAQEALLAELGDLIGAAGGRTLALFTSWRAMHAATESLAPKLPYRVLAQGQMPKAKLIAAFSDEESTCLFATMSFWQGVDVVGPTLSLVALDRIPFPRPDDPLLEARRARAGPRAFQTVDIPRAATLLAQGAGRLIRSASDTGVVAVLDRRLATAGYGKVLRAALPPMPFTTDKRVAVALLETIARKRSAGDEAVVNTPAG